MMRLLDPAGYRRMPWANGRGHTTEIARMEDDAGLLWRLSMAQVTEDGPFSLFPGIDRSLTVIDGAGFALESPRWRLAAAPFLPVGFPGDVAVSARDVTGASVDFNVMWRRGALMARVRSGTGMFAAESRSVAVLALADQQITVNDSRFQVPAQGCLMGGAQLQIVADALVLVVELSDTG